MKYLVDQFPNFCPCCGQNNKDSDRNERMDFIHRNSMNCNSCGSQFQKLTIKIEKKIEKDLDCYWSFDS